MKGRAWGRRDAYAAPAPVAVLRAHSSPVSVVRFVNLTTHGSSAVAGDAPHATLVSGDHRGTIHVWNLASRRSARRIDAHVHGATGQASTLATGGVLAVAAASGRLLTQGRDGLVKVWDLAAVGGHAGDSQLEGGPNARCRAMETQRAAPSALVTLKTYAATFCKFSVHGRSGGITLIAAPATEPSQLDVWDLRTGTVIMSFKPPPQSVGPKPGCETISGSGAGAGRGCWGMCTACKILRRPGDGACSAVHSFFLAAAYEDGCLRVFDSLRPGAPAITLKMLDDVALSFAVNGESARGVAVGAGADAVAFVLDLQALRARVARRFSLGAKTRHGASEVVLREWDENIFAVAGWDNRVRIFDWKRLRPLAILKYHEDSVYSLGFSPRPIGAQSIHGSIVPASASCSHRDEIERAGEAAARTHSTSRASSACADVILASSSKDARIALWNVY